MADVVIPAASRPHEKYDRLIATARKHPPITTAVCHPCDAVSLESAVEAAKLGLVKPILVGPLSACATPLSKAGSTSRASN